MTIDPSLPPITRLYQACEPLESLHPDDPRWVDFDAVRGEDNVVDSFARDIRRARADGANVKLFSGHRGVGKTSELFRLKALLEKGGDGRPGFVVVYCDVSDKLDVNDLDFPDLLVFVAAQLQQQLADMQLPGFTPATTYLKRAWDDIRSMLGAQVEFKEAELDTGFGKLVMDLRNRPTSRALLRDAVEQHSTSLLIAVNDLLGSAKASAIQAGHAGLVLIVDGLDKLVRRELEHGGNTHDRLFIDRSEQLAALAVHTVYTVPISLIYSPRIGQLEHHRRTQHPGVDDPPAPASGRSHHLGVAGHAEDERDGRQALRLCPSLGHGRLRRPQHPRLFVRDERRPPAPPADVPAGRLQRARRPADHPQGRRKGRQTLRPVPHPGGAR
jgi:hypothetical protein